MYHSINQITTLIWEYGQPKRIDKHTHRPLKIVDVGPLVISAYTLCGLCIPELSVHIERERPTKYASLTCTVICLFVVDHEGRGSNICGLVTSMRGDTEDKVCNPSLSLNIL